MDNGKATITATSGSASGTATLTVVPANQISIPDPNLRKLIEDHLDKPSGSPIYQYEMRRLRSLVATPDSYESGGISDLEGIQYVTNLEELDLDAAHWDAARHEWINLNDLSDLSPLSDLLKLTILNLSGSDDSITDLSPLSRLTNLQVLRLWNADVQNLQPLADLTNLGNLDLGSNDHLSDLSPLSGLTKLKGLMAYDNSVRDITPLAALTNLEHLDLGGNEIDDISPVAGLINLESLDLSYNNLSDLSPLQGLTKLWDLDIAGCNDWAAKRSCSTPPDLAAISGLKELSRLRLDHNGLSDLAPLSHLNNLQLLWIVNNEVSDLTPLSTLTHLSLLDLYQNNVFDLAPLAANTGLGDSDYVDVRRNPLNDTAVFTHIPLLQAKGVDVHFDEVLVIDKPVIYNDNVFVLPVEEELRSANLPLVAYSKWFYERFSDVFDFLMLISNLEIDEGVGSAGYVGSFTHVRNSVQGIGVSSFSDDSYGSAANLQGVIHFPYYFAVANGPTLHEIMHLWGNHIVDTSGKPSPHWGFSSANGQLGGFDIANLVALGDGQYTAGDFSPSGLALNSQPYSLIELYLAGMATPDEVPDLWVAEDGVPLRDVDGNFVVAQNGHQIFTANKVRTYTIEDIIAEHGARVPDASQAQRSFRAAAVLLVSDQRPATREILETVSANVSWFSHPGDDEFAGYNFFEGTRARATIAMDGLSGVEKRAGQASADHGSRIREYNECCWVREVGGAVGSPGRLRLDIDSFRRDSRGTRR